MVRSNPGLHHYHKRKGEIHPLTTFVDKIIYFAGVLGPIMTLPQLLKIYMAKSAAGVSALSWFSYTIIAMVWLIYGIIHKEKPIIITYSLWIIMDGAIAVGAIMY